MMTLNTPQAVPLCSGFGQHHTDNPNSPAQKPYKTITYDGIVKMVGKPPKKDKKNAQWFIPSDALTREAQKQREQGRFYAVWCDFDQHTLQESIQTVLATLCCSHIIYSTSSATPEYQKWRVIIPLAAPSTANQFEQVAAIINDKFEAAGIVPDRASERCNQICYLPNQGEFYRFHIETAYPPLDWQHALADELAEKQRQAEQEQTAKNEQRERSRQKAITRMETDSLSPIDAYNGAYPVEQSLEFYGYKRVGKRYLSPNSESGQAGVTIENGKWFSSHGSDSGIGKPCTNGGTMGDAFDLFTYYEHNGDRNAATKAAGNLFTVGGATITKHNQREYAKQTSQAKESMKAQQNATVISLPGGGVKTENHQEQAFKLISCVDLMSRTYKPDWLIKGFIERGNLGLIFGNSASGKSLLVMDMCFCIATGLEFKGLATKQGTVVYICGEGFGGLQKRLLALSQHYGIEKPDNFYLSEQPAAFMDMASADNVRQAIQAIGNVSLIVIDTFHRNMGQGDENSAKDIATFLSNVDTFLKPTGAAVLIIHHSGHDQKERSRGSSSIRAAMDVEFLVSKEDSQVTVKNTKMKDFDPPKQLNLKMVSVDIGLFDEDGERINSVVLEPTDCVIEKSGVKPLSQTEKNVLGALLQSLNEHGIVPPQNIIARFPDTPKNCPKKVVHIDDFRPLAYPFLNVAENSKRQTLKRIIETFEKLNKSMFYNGYLWIIN